MYIPKSRIKTNLYTPGREFILVNDNTDYVGFYHKTYNNNFFTGKNPDDKPNYPLIPTPPSSFTSYEGDNTIYIEYSDEVLSYVQINSIDVNSTTKSPKLYLPTPTEQDYKLGEFRRYFCKKRNEYIYLEISKEDYDKLVKRNSTIDYKLWFPFNIPWLLVGDKNKVSQVNKDIVLLQINKDKLYGFNKYLKEDYLKYYKV
jgi:hypothetical protein